ncbi:MAG: hypothetical protein QM758_12780 [Armatimonas sp.]
MERRNTSLIKSSSEARNIPVVRWLMPTALLSFFFMVGCGGGDGDGGDPAKEVRPVIRSAGVSEATNTLFIQGEHFAPDDKQHQVFVDGLDMTAQTLWTDSQLTVKGLPISGKGSHGDIQVVTHGVFYSRAVQLTEWHGKITVTGRDLLNYVGEQTVGTYNVHWRASLNGIFSQKSNGAQSAKDSTCTADASGVFNGPDYVETISRAGDPSIPVSFLNPSQIDRFFDASVTFDLSHAGSGTEADPIDPARYTLALNCTAKDQTGINAIKVSKSNGAIDTYTKFLVNTGITEAIPGHLDDKFNIKTGSWTSSDGSTTVTWEDMPATSPPDFSP